MTNPTEEVKLPELEVVAWSKVSKEHIPRMRMLNESYVKGVWDVPLVRLSDAQTEIERLLTVVVEARRVLEMENSKGALSAIRDTIWRGPAETLFDYLDAAIDAARQTTREQP